MGRPETELRLKRIEDPTAPPTSAETDGGPSVSTEGSTDPDSGASMFGVFYPKHYIVTIFGDQSDADSAVADLMAAGFATKDVGTWPGSEVVANHEAYVADRGLLQKIGSRLPSEEHDVLNDYIEQGRAGAVFLTVFAPEEGQRQTAAPILANNDGALMRYYGDNTITNLTLDDRSNS